MITLHAIKNKESEDASKHLTESYLNGESPEGVVVQTCSRTEHYYGEGYIPKPVINHLFRVVSGLDSTFIGECAIQAQVKQAYMDAGRKSRLNKSLHKLFQTALSVGKKVRYKTGISQGAMSHSQAAVEVLTQTVTQLDKKVITIIGINNLNENIIKFLNKKGVETILVGNRTHQKATELADRLSCKAFNFDNLTEVLKRTDILITATAAPHHVVHQHNVQPDKNIVIIDLAFPADVDPEIGKFSNIQLFDLEQIEAMVNKNHASRKKKIEVAEEIIEHEVETFYQKINY